MKKIFTLFCFLFASLFAINQSKANDKTTHLIQIPVSDTNRTKTICFIDNNHAKWILTFTISADGEYSGTGTGFFFEGNWPVYITGTSGHIQFHVIDPAPDGCRSVVDSLIYTITGYIPIITDTLRTWQASATFVSYCFGSEFKTGPVGFAGPCGKVKAPPPGEYGPETHGNGTSLLIAPNPVKNNVSIYLNINKESQVQVTVYNYLQQPVKTLLSGLQTKGKHVLYWNLIGANGTRIYTGLYRVVAIVDGKTYSSIMQVAE